MGLARARLETTDIPEKLGKKLGKIHESISWLFTLSRFLNLIWTLVGNVKGLFQFLWPSFFFQEPQNWNKAVQIWAKTWVSTRDHFGQFILALKLCL